MAFNVNSCSTNNSNTGLGQCQEDFGVLRKIVLCPTSFEIATQTLAETESTWITARNDDEADRIYPLPQIFSYELEDGEDVYEEGIDAIEFVREGGEGLTALLKRIAFCEHKNLRTLNDQKWAIYVITSTGYILGWSEDDTKFLPRPLRELRIGRQTKPTGDTLARTTVKVSYETPGQWDNNGAWVKPTAFDPLTSIVGIQDVDLSASASDGTAMTLTVTTACDSVAVDGLAEADWTITDVAGNTESINTYTDNGDGTYSFTFSPTLGADNYNINLADPGDQATSDPAYEQSAAATWTVS